MNEACDTAVCRQGWNTNQLQPTSELAFRQQKPKPTLIY